MEMLRESGTDAPYIGPLMDSVLSGRLHAGKVRKRTKNGCPFAPVPPPFSVLFPLAYSRHPGEVMKF